MYSAPPLIVRRSFLGRLRRAPAHFAMVYRLQRRATWLDRILITARLTWLLIRGIQ
jgi:hypothetical protein